MPTSAGAPRQPVLPAAVLWDMDGTLVDTEPYWMTAERELVEAAGGTWSEEQGLQLVGNSLLDSARIILDQTPVSGSPEAVVDLIQARVEQLMRERVPWRPGARELLTQVRAREVPCALVTMSYDVLAQVLLAALPEGTFAAVVTGDQVRNGKPHPEAYLTASTLLGVDPHSCVAIEDSPTGVASAVAASVPTIAVPHMVPIESRPGITVVRTLQELTVDQIWVTATAGLVAPLPPARRRPGTTAGPVTSTAAEGDDVPWWRRAWEAISDPFTSSDETDQLRALQSPVRAKQRACVVPPPLGRPLPPWGRLARHFQVAWTEADLAAIRTLLARPGVSTHRDGTRVYTGRAALVPDRGVSGDASEVAVFIDGSQVGHLKPRHAQAYFHEVLRAAERGAYVECPATVRVTPQDKRVKLRIHLRLATPGELLPTNTPPEGPHAILPLGRRVQVTQEEDHLESLAGVAEAGAEVPLLVVLRARKVALPRTVVDRVEVELEGEKVGVLSEAQSARLARVIDRLDAQGFLAVARAWVSGTPDAPQVTLDINRDDDDLQDWLSLHQRAGRLGSPREIVPGQVPPAADR